MIINTRKSKTNKSKRHDQTPVFRHAQADRCPLFAMAMYLAYIFDMLKFPYPPLGQVGIVNNLLSVEWYDWCLFPGSRRRRRKAFDDNDDAEEDDQEEEED
jgi:hypothetical protein